MSLEHRNVCILLHWAASIFVFGEMTQLFPDLFPQNNYAIDITSNACCNSCFFLLVINNIYCQLTCNLLINWLVDRGDIAMIVSLAVRESIVLLANQAKTTLCNKCKSSLVLLLNRFRFQGFANRYGGLQSVRKTNQILTNFSHF